MVLPGASVHAGGHQAIPGTMQCERVSGTDLGYCVTLCTMSRTDLGYGVMRCATDMAGISKEVCAAISLRACYAMSGTDIAYAATG
eukprot:2391856-Rhodomonas_salina.2